MNIRDSWKTWALVGAILIFAGLASAVVPFVLDQLDSESTPTQVQKSGPQTTTIDVSQLPFIGEVLVEIDFIANNIQGLPITMVQAVGFLFGVVLVSVGALGIGITLITLLLSRWINGVYGDEEYQSASAELEQKQKEHLKVIQQEYPPASSQESERQVRSRAWTFAVLFILLTMVTSYVVTVAYFAGVTWSVFGLGLSAAVVINLIVLVISIIVVYLVLLRRDARELDSAEFDNKPVNWGTIWVIITGLLVVGIGAGIALALSAPSG